MYNLANYQKILILLVESIKVKNIELKVYVVGTWVIHVEPFRTFDIVHNCSLLAILARILKYFSYWFDMVSTLSGTELKYRWNNNLYKASCLDKNSFRTLTKLLNRKIKMNIFSLFSILTISYGECLSTGME